MKIDRSAYLDHDKIHEAARQARSEVVGWAVLVVAMATVLLCVWCIG